MPFGFFSRLHFRTRDSILEGAVEAAQILERGPDEQTFRTKAVEAIEAQEAAPLPALSAPISPVQGTTEAPARGQTKPPAATAAAGSPRTPRRTAKTEAMFDVNRDQP